MTIQALAQAARPINDADWGTPRQIDAENLFFGRIQRRVTKSQFEQLEAYCLKATTDEMIDEALRIIHED